MNQDITNSELQAMALAVRKSVIETLSVAGSGHTAGSLGMADVFTLLYFKILNHRPSEPDWPQRDRLVLSNGHIAPVQYSAMAHSGYFDIAELMTLRKFGSRLQGHPHREYLPGIETSSGPLGSGLSQALGMAIADRIDSVADRYIYCLMGDGELDEGQVWEAALHSGKEKIGNLIAIIDRNHIQIDGNTDDVMPLEPLKDKWESFNWHVQEVDGHDFDILERAISAAKAESNMPSIIIANTTPGKGVPEIEGDYKWHGKPPTPDEVERFISQLQVDSL
jgi:transketolase